MGMARGCMTKWPADSRVVWPDARRLFHTPTVRAALPACLSFQPREDESRLGWDPPRGMLSANESRISISSQIATADSGSQGVKIFTAAATD